VLKVRWKVNGKVRQVEWHEGAQAEYNYNSTLSLISALDGGVRLTPHSGNFTHGNDPVPIVLRGPQGRSGQARKISLPPGFDSRTVRSLASRYSDNAFPVHTARWRHPTQNMGDFQLYGLRGLCCCFTHSSKIMTKFTLNICDYRNTILPDVLIPCTT
jgi:hypothetical protein